MFDIDSFTADCRSALKDACPQGAIREVVARAVSDPNSIVKALGEPTRAEMQILHHTPQLTILNLIWAPKMTLFPHDHNMWAVIGMYSGREDNIFWRRLPEDRKRVKAAGAKSICDGDAVILGHDIIHSVTNPIERFTCALHVYGGDFFNADRREWDPDSLTEQHLNPQHLIEIFDAENSRLLTTLSS
jgi:predicted metal-dependent enzyme (double-stranded beta helix superfamily)